MVYRQKRTSVQPIFQNQTKTAIVAIILFVVIIVVLILYLSVSEKQAEKKLRLQIEQVYSSLPPREHSTQVAAWKGLEGCKLNLDSEINVLRTLFLQGNNTQWITRLGVFQDKLSCMDTETILQIDDPLGNALHQLAALVRRTTATEEEFTACNNFNALVQPSLLVMDLTLPTGKSSIYHEFKEAKDVGQRCNFYYPKVSFPFITWNVYSGKFDLYGIVCEKGKQNPFCWAAHDLFWKFALDPVNYGVGCTLTEWASSGFVCAKGVAFRSPGGLLEAKLKDNVIIQEDVQMMYVSPLGISGKEIVDNIAGKCTIPTAGTGSSSIRPAANGTISGASGGGRVTPGSGLPGGILSATIGEDRLSALVRPLLPCAEGSSGQGWESVGNAMKLSCTSVGFAVQQVSGEVQPSGGSAGGSDVEPENGLTQGGTESENKGKVPGEHLACANRFQNYGRIQPEPVIVFNQRLTQHGITGPKSGCGEGGGVKEEGKDTNGGYDGVEQSKKLDQLKEAALEECGKTKGCGEQLKKMFGISDWDTATKEQKENFKKDASKLFNINVLSDKGIIEKCNGKTACTYGQEIYIAQSTAQANPDWAAPNVYGSPSGAQACGTKMTTKGVVRHEIDHALSNAFGGASETEVRGHDTHAEVWDTNKKNGGTAGDSTDDISISGTECAADYVNDGGASFSVDNSVCSAAFNGALDNCIRGTGPNPLSEISRADWCKWAICEDAGKKPPLELGETGQPVDIGGVAPGAKGPGYGLGGDTRGESQDYEGIPCGEALLDLFGMIDCEMFTGGEGAAASGESAGFCQRGSTVDTEEAQTPTETPKEDSRCGSVAVEFECANSLLGIGTFKQSSTNIFRISKGTAVR